MFLVPTEQTHAVRSYIIARVRHLKSLNGSSLEGSTAGLQPFRNERDDAELYYISKVKEEIIRESLSDEALNMRHPRYMELCQSSSFNHCLNIKLFRA